jgi:hypothetical protein
MQPLGVDRGLTLSRLTQNSSRNVIQNIVREQIKLIDAAIISAHSSGFNTIEHQLPINFGINNMVKADAQVMIYSELILLLTSSEEDGGKGFEHVRIDISPSGTKAILIIQWINGMDNEELIERKKLIANHSLRKKITDH